MKVDTLSLITKKRTMQKKNNIYPKALQNTHEIVKMAYYEIWDITCG